MKINYAEIHSFYIGVCVVLLPWFISQGWMILTGITTLLLIVQLLSWRQIKIKEGKW